jgi:hypothetical protein
MLNAPFHAALPAGTMPFAAVKQLGDNAAASHSKQRPLELTVENKPLSEEISCFAFSASESSALLV